MDQKVLEMASDWHKGPKRVPNAKYFFHGRSGLPLGVRHKCDIPDIISHLPNSSGFIANLILCLVSLLKKQINNSLKRIFFKFLPFKTFRNISVSPTPGGTVFLAGLARVKFR